MKMPFPAAAAVGALAAAAFLLRFLAAHDGPHLDELWTLHLLRGMKGIGDILWGTPIDNNHPLNTLYLYWLGEDAAPLVRRLLSIAAGAAQAAAAAWLAARWSPGAALAAAILSALAFPFVFHGAEARGYALLLLFGTLAWRDIALWCESRARLFAWRFALWILLGLWSHPTMAFAALCFGIWAALRVGNVSALVSGFAPAALAVTIAWAGMGRGFVYGIANFPGTPTESAGEMMVYLFGLPAFLPPVPVFAAAMAGAALGSAFLFRRKDPEAALFLTGALLLPLGLAAFAAPHELAPRYFLIPALFLLMLTARLLGAAPKPAAAVLLALFALGNLDHLRRFHEIGTGDPAPDLARLASGFSGEIRVAATQEWRGRLIVEDLAGKDAKRWRFAPRETWAEAPPDLLLAAGDSKDWTPPESLGLEIAPGKILLFRWAATRRHYGFSGHAWAILKRSESP